MKKAVASLALASVASAIPQVLWDRKPGHDFYTDYYLLGNGYMGISTGGDPVVDQMHLNLDTLWTGGPLNRSDTNMYNGGNPTSPNDPTLLHNIRASIFSQGNSSVTALQESADNYGSLTTAGWFYAKKDNVTYTDYKRWLSLDDGYAGATWSSQGVDYNRTTFCSYPEKQCVYHAASSASASTEFGFNTVRDLSTANVTCVDNTTLSYQGQAEPNGMQYEIQTRCRSDGSISCSSSIAGNATLSVVNSTWVTCVLAGDTEYNIDAGTSETNYSFTGTPFHDNVVEIINASCVDFQPLFDHHQEDYHALYDAVKLDLGATETNASATTQELLNVYTIDQGNVQLDELIFNMGRYLLISSARGTLPCSLQGIWTGAAQQYLCNGEVDEFNNSNQNGVAAPNNSCVYHTSTQWGSDFHANINLQMNYWPAETTGLSKLTPTLWALMQKTWLPRGAETASFLYNSSGWVSHDEMNPFGYTGMKLGGTEVKDQVSGQQWSDYQAGGAWLVQQLWDHYIFGDSEEDFMSTTGWPIIKSTTDFWLDNLFEDKYFNDGSLVVAPCNSPEQPTHLNATFGCAHYQQTVQELFQIALQAYSLVNVDDADWYGRVEDSLSRMDIGVRIGRWGQLQEWKFDADNQTDVHRHISHLTGYYPGSVLTSYNGSEYTQDEVTQAVTTSLEARGNATHYGWAKMHRAAVYASLGNASYAHHLFKYMISEDFNGNMLDIYWQKNNSVFQIDANEGAVGYVMNAIANVPAPSALDQPLTVNLLRAIPDAWASGSVTGARIRGGIGLNATWSDGQLQSAELVMDKGFQAWYVKVSAPCSDGYIVKKEGWMNPGDSWSI